MDSGYRFILKNDPFSDTVVSTSFKALTAPGRARTANLQFRRLSLYPVELRVLSIADMDDRIQPGFGKAKNPSIDRTAGFGEGHPGERPAP